MQQKIKKLESLKKIAYDSYERLLKKSWPDLLKDPTITLEYALVDGRHLPWKDSKSEDKAEQPLLYIGSITKWKTELNSSKEIDLKGYSYGACKIVPVGKTIHIYLEPSKGKLTDAKLLKPIQKVLKKLKPKVFLEVVANLDAVEAVEGESSLVEDASTANASKVFHQLGKELQKYHLGAVKIKQHLKKAKPEQQAKLRIKYHQILRRLKHICANWKTQIIPYTTQLSEEKKYPDWQQIYEEWQGYFDKRQAAKEGKETAENTSTEEERLYTKLASNLEQFYANIDKGELLEVDLIETNIDNLESDYRRWQQLAEGKASTFAAELKEAGEVLEDIRGSWPTIKPLLSRSAVLQVALSEAAQEGDIAKMMTVLDELNQIDEQLKRA